MSNVTAQLIKALRDRTGVGMTKCKEALVQSSGDIEGAIEFLRKAGIASAVKKAERETNEGAIDFAESDSHIALLQMNAETDFVVNNEKFRAFQREMVEEALISKPATPEAFLECAYSKDSSKTIDEKRKELISVLGENIEISKILIITKETPASYGLYSHMKGKIFTLVEISGSSDEKALAYDIAMHAAAEAPDFLVPEDVPAETKAREEDIAKSTIPAGKPPEVTEKILAGKMRSFYEQVCLVLQKYIKDPSVSIQQLVEARGKESGKELKLTRFVRWQMGA
jgi:elongation factor Ts